MELIKNSSKKDVDTLFNSLAIYKIPDYQRDYSWTKDEAEEFLEDFEDFSENGLSYTPQYLGVIITSSSNIGLHAVHEVIDGQQRLTTLFLLFWAIRQFAKNNSMDRIVSNVEQKIFYHIGTDLKYKLDSHEYFNTFFQNLIAEDCTFQNFSGNKFIKDVYFWFFNFLNEKIKPELLENFYMAVIRSEFVHIEIGSASPFEIFERVNSRGVDLTVSDLLKNKLFMEANRVDNLDSIKLKWDLITEKAEQVSENIKKLSFTTLIRYFYISRFGYITEKRLYKKIRDQYINFYNRDIERFVNDFDSAVNILILLSKNRSELSNEDIKKLPGKNTEKGYLRTMLALKEFSVIQPYSLLLALFAKERDFDLRNWLSRIEVFHFVYSYITSGPAREFEKKYSETAKNIFNTDSKSDVEKELSRFTNELKIIINNSTNKEKFIEDTIRKLKYGKSSSVIRFYFEHIEESYFKRNLQGDTLINDPQTSLDHILAQNIEENHTIGNLIILDKDLNQKFQDKTYQEKRNLIIKNEVNSRFEIVYYMFKKYENWDSETINLWGRELGEMFWESVVRKYFNF